MHMKSIDLKTYFSSLLQDLIQSLSLISIEMNSPVDCTFEKPKKDGNHNSMIQKQRMDLSPGTIFISTMCDARKEAYL